MFKQVFVFTLTCLITVAYPQSIDSSQIFSDDIAQDSLLFIDSSKVAIDSIKNSELERTKIIFQQPFSNQSYFISKTDILRNDYRYTGDFFKVFPFSFERSYGFIGQPNDIYLYGEGSNTTSYFMDGVPIELFDFNHIQSEDIDSIEIVPLPREFLYGFATNPVSVNFISKDIIPTKPYSRVKYYEGPSGEAFIDGIFSMNLLKDLIASVDITNRKVDDSYKNSAFSIWQTKAKLRYNLSDDINLIGSYYFSKSTTGINGGVNVDAIKQTASDINSTLYNETLAPVYYENNSLDFKQHNFGLKIQAKPVANATTSLNLFYNYYQNQYVHYQMYTSDRNKSDGEKKTLGLALDQRYYLTPICFSLQSGYQSVKSSSLVTNNYANGMSDSSYNNSNYDDFFISPLFSVILFDSLIIPSLYYKYEFKSRDFSSDNRSYYNNALGADITINIDKYFSIYIGYSGYYNTPSINYLINASEIKFCFTDSCRSFNILLFNKSTSITSQWGIGLSGSFQFWKILFEGRFSNYFCELEFLTEYVQYFSLPKTQFLVGIYYKDNLFNSNLDLKGGLLFNYLGKQKFHNRSIYSSGDYFSDIAPSLTLDFTVSAEIQKAAIVYFTWENLLDKKYYITPYFPMLERNIRFGIAWEIFN